MEALGYAQTYHHQGREYPPREGIPVALISIPLLGIPAILYFLLVDKATHITVVYELNVGSASV